MLQQLPQVTIHCIEVKLVSLLLSVIWHGLKVAKAMT